MLHTYLRRALLYKDQWRIMLKSVLLRFLDHFMHLLERTENEDTGCTLFALSRLLSQEPGSECEEVVDVKTVIPVKSRLVGKVALPVLIIPSLYHMGLLAYILSPRAKGISSIIVCALGML